MFSAASDAVAGDLLNVTPTSVVRRAPGGGLQIIIADLAAATAHPAATARITYPAAVPAVEIPLGGVQKDMNRFYLDVPVTVRPESVDVAVFAEGRAIARTRALLTPPRKRKIYDVQVSHHDLGYADYYHFMRRDVREMGIEMALEFCRRTDSWDSTAHFHWTVETSEPLTKFISSQPPAVVAELARRIREGRIDLGGLHNSVYTEMMGQELMARLFYTPNRTVVDLLDIPPSRTALITDVVGLSRALPLYLKEADIPYFYHGYNDAVDGFAPASAHPVFYWNAPDGDARMPLFRSFPYYSPDRLLRYDLPEIVKMLTKYDADPRWTYDCLIAEDSYDFSVPQFENVEGIRQWNAAYSNPVLVSGTFTKFFDDIRRQADTTAIPVVDKDAPNAWADQDGTDAALLGDARRLNFDLPTAEKLATVAYALGSAGYPWKEIWQAYHKLLSYHEHTNGAFSEEDVIPIPLLKDRKAANANYYEAEQVMHKALVGEGRALAGEARDHAIAGLRRLVAAPHDRTIVVFNPLSFARTDVAELAQTLTGQWNIIDNATGHVVLSQQLPGGRILFEARDVPATGYRTYRLVDGRKSRPPFSGPAVKGLVLENDLYRVTIDSVTGGVEGLLDKKRGLELVDREAPYGLNEYMYQRIEDPSSRALTSYKPRLTGVTTFSGPLAAGITARIAATGSHAVEQTTILYTGQDRIDVDLRIDKAPSGRMLKQTTSESKEALFYALPFAVPGFTIRHELGGAVVEPVAGQFPGSTTNFYGVQHFTDLSNGRFGVTVSSTDAPLVQYGSPRPALWNFSNDAESILRKPEKSHLFLYLMNNMFFTNIPLSQPGPASFRWSIRAHDGGWQEGRAARFGRERAHPLVAFTIDKAQQGPLRDAMRSFLSTDRDNVVCTALKPAEANGPGFILRFAETEGRATDVSVTAGLFPRITRAEETNLVEVDRGVPVRITGGNTLQFSIPPFGLKTIRVVPATEHPVEAIRGLNGRAVADREVRLTWTPHAPGRTNHYRIYRSTSPVCPPTLMNRIGTATAGGFTDVPVLNHGGWLDVLLEPATDYYYRVAAVGSHNDEGPASAAVRVRTLPAEEKNSVPRKVLGLAATDVSPITRFTYNCLIFYTNPESDVVRYRVYRSEEPGFRADAATLLEEVDATQTFDHVIPHQFATVRRSLRDFTMLVYPDESARPNRRYYYRVCAVDAAGQAGELSDEVSARAAIERITFEGSTFFHDSAVVDIRPLLDDGSVLRYTLDGSEPGPASPLYTAPLILHTPTRVRAALFLPGQSVPAVKGDATYRRSLYPPPEYLQPFSEKWPGQGVLNLVDGKRGTLYPDGFFQGFEQNDMDVIINLGGSREIESVSASVLQDIRAWIFFPEQVSFAVSVDGARFDPVGEVRLPNEFERKEGSYRKEYGVTFPKRTVAFIRVRAKNIGMCPPWHGGAEYKGKAWVFCDEVVVK